MQVVHRHSPSHGAEDAWTRSNAFAWQWNLIARTRAQTQDVGRASIGGGEARGPRRLELSEFAFFFKDQEPLLDYCIQVSSYCLFRRLSEHKEGVSLKLYVGKVVRLRKQFRGTNNHEKPRFSSQANLVSR